MELKEKPCFSSIIKCGYVLPRGGMYSCREYGHKDLHDKFSQPNHDEYNNFLEWKKSNYDDFADFLVYEKGWAKITNSMFLCDKVLFVNKLTASQKSIIYR